MSKTSSLDTQSTSQFRITRLRDWDNEDKDKEYDNEFDEQDMQEILMDCDAEAGLSNIGGDEVYALCYAFHS